ncbi:MAG: hypothetical protein H6625_11020 [Bdellovibrionaceae bacterium]|nr:hypothetical protein [Pseudobdellovibrionaceae bacterium]
MSAQSAIVQNSGAAIYKERSFDSDPISYLEAGQKVRISRKKYPGKDGFGLFFKVIVSKSLKGYIADVDVIPQFTKTKFTKKIKDNPEFEDYDKKPEKKKEPMLFTRYFGAQLAFVNYTELISGRKLSSKTTLYGLKMTGPGFLLEEVPLDIDILISITPPSYYDEYLTTAPATGFIFVSNLALKMPFYDAKNLIIYYSLGFTGSYTNFKIPIGSSNLDSQEVKVGVIGGLGAAMRFSEKYFFQFDTKYYYEKTQYVGYGASFGFQY